MLFNELSLRIVKCFELLCYNIKCYYVYNYKNILYKTLRLNL